MLEKIYRYIVGCFIFTLDGSDRSKERFINILKHKNIKLWPKKQKYIIYSKNYREVLQYADKVSVLVKLVGKTGLPYFFAKHKKRKIFFILFFVFIIYIININNYIWEIKIECGDYYSDEQILQFISDDVHIGTRKKKVDCDELEAKLMEKYDRFCWVNCYYRGTVFFVEFSETAKQSEVDEYDKPCNIVAAKDCIITDSVSSKGINMVEPGMEVKKGDVLISGIIYITNDYDELTDTKYINAKGEVKGQVKYYYNDSFELEYYKKEGTKKKKNHFNIGYKGKYLFKDKKSDSETDVVTYTYPLKVGKDIYLPFSVKRTEVCKYNVVKCKYTEKEAKEKAYLKLDSYIDELTKNGVEIVENNVKIYIEGKKCVAKGTILTRECVGIPAPINPIIQGE